MTPQGVPPADIIWLTPNVFTEPFWLATAQHRLVLPRCTACGTFRFPPSPFCYACRAQAVEWVEHDGNGTVYSFTVIRHAVIPDVKDALPFIAAVVELPDTNGCRIIGDIVGVDANDVRIGMDVRIDWYDVREGTTIPIFRL
ncbi:MAG TPA: Zn-ribbon domain-containing OB-fold protein [Acidimicrobiia bacterium]|nr:Zn-ribbon domain-containing OB-fold protein [Acidimicrobiia bacterium]